MKILDSIPVSNYGSCLVLSNAFVAPLDSNDNPSSLSGGLLFGHDFPEWAYKYRQIHFLGPNGETAYGDSPTELHDSCKSHDTIYNEEFIFLGVFYNHFGHFMAECVHRLYIAKAFKKTEGSKFCVVLWPNTQPELNGFQKESLLWMGINPEDVLVVTRKSLFARLLVPSQASALGFQYSSSSYIDFLTAVASENTEDLSIPRLDCIFVSRSPYVSTGGTLGESFMDSYLDQYGISVIRPERLSLKDQMCTYLGSSKIIFSEGSSVHGLELLGSVNADGFMIGRGRENASITISKLGQARFQSWYNDQSQITLPSLYPLAGTNQENINKGPSLYKITTTVSALIERSFLPDTAQEIGHNSSNIAKRLRNACDADLGRYVSDFHYDHFERILANDKPSDFYYSQLRRLIKEYLGYWENFI